MSASFEAALREQCQASGMRRLRAKRLLAVLDAKPSKRRTRILERLEAHAAAFIRAETGKTGAIDWGAIDWEKFFDTLLKFLMAILPLFL